MKKSLTAGLSALALAVSAASVALVGGSTAGHAAGTPSSAYGIGATGLVPIEPTPYVESTDGSLVEDTLVEIPGDPVISAGVVNVEAENNRAFASVTDITIGDGLLAELPPEVTAPLSEGCAELTAELQEVQTALDDTTTSAEDGLGEFFASLDEATQDSPLEASMPDAIHDDISNAQLAAACDVLAGSQPLGTIDTVEAECTGDSGDTTVADLNLLGTGDATIDTETLGTALGVEDLLMIEEGRETTNADGTYTIDGLVVQLLPGTEAESEIVISSATCGEVTRDARQKPDEAPAPTPVEANLPVTG